MARLGSSPNKKFCLSGALAASSSSSSVPSFKFSTLPVISPTYYDPETLPSRIAPLKPTTEHKNSNRKHPKRWLPRMYIDSNIQTVVVHRMKLRNSLVSYSPFYYFYIYYDHCKWCPHNFFL